MERLLPIAERIARLLRDRRETVAVAESSSGGLISASLLSVPGASSYFVGAAVVYTGRALSQLMGVERGDLQGIRSSSEPYAALLAQTTRQRLGTIWALAETGAAGPDGNGYGDPPGHSCLAVAGPASALRTLQTGVSLRHENMTLFAEGALRLLEETLSARG